MNDLDHSQKTAAMRLFFVECILWFDQFFVLQEIGKNVQVYEHQNRISLILLFSSPIRVEVLGMS